MRTWLALLMLLLAGCGDAPAGDSEPDGLNSPDVETGPDVGAISGIVVSTTITPIANANVSLQGIDLKTTTDANGGFVFEDVQPGTYFILAQAAGYSDAQTSATVVAGQVAKPKIQLPVDTTPQPYQQTQQFQGHMIFSDFYAVYVLTTVLGPNDLCKCFFTFDSDPGVETVVVDAVWESSTIRAEEHDMYWDIWGGEGHDSAWRLSGETWHVDGGAFGSDVTTWDLQISSGEQPDVEQEFEGFVTFWYVESAPSGWSYLTP